jgi:hypothetical protein
MCQYSLTLADSASSHPQYIYDHYIPVSYWSERKSINMETVIKCGGQVLLVCAAEYNNKTTRWTLVQETPEATGQGVSRPKTITSVFLLPQKSHECGFIFILCHKNYRKTTFNILCHKNYRKTTFNSGIPHAKFAMTLHRRSYDITSTVQQNAWHHWDSALTHMLYLIFLCHPRIPRLDRWTSWVKFC